MLTAILFVPALLVSQPIEWQCYPGIYADGYSCDCGCGIVDPDCGGLASEASHDFAYCNQSFCLPGAVPLQGAPAQCVPNACGDGFVAKGELCDDGDGPGCDESCQAIAEGYRCSGLGAGCSVPRCGDRTVDVPLGERCDDGNEDAGDGCFACEPEAGFVCRMFGGCTPTVCGDFNIEWDWETQTGETCEDGNVDTGDGCDAACRTEAGWACRWDGCFQVVCGDGIVARGDFGDGEMCDDGNTEVDDGCDASCKTEAGWYCDDFLGCSRVVCGDLVLAPGEMCDDGNGDAGDGCSDVCQTEPGFACGWMAGRCNRVVCGDGLVQSDDLGTIYEECDDGNGELGDGCDASCRREPGYVCNEAGCHLIVCGDGLVDREGGAVRPGAEDKQAIPIDPGPGPGPGPGGTEGGAEQCDDGNVEPGDGCSELCAIEDGWICELPGSPCVRPVCGDGLIEGAESCDDGNDLAGDGCTSACKREPGWVCSVPGQLCEPLPRAWVCSAFIYGAGDGCDCGCGGRDPDCPEPSSIGDCTYNHCLEEAPYPTAEDPTQCGNEPPEAEPEEVEPVEPVEPVENDEAEEAEAGPEEVTAEAAPESAEADTSVSPRAADEGCRAAGGTAALAWLMGAVGFVVVRRRGLQLPRPGADG